MLGGAVAAGLAACGAHVSENRSRPDTSPSRPVSTLHAQAPSAAMPTPRGATTSPALVDPASVRANELGVVPVMMYHRITDDVTGDYDTTPKDFRAQLQRMFSTGYRPVCTIDLVRGQLAVAAGYTPVVLSFDDGYANQFRLSPTGQIDPDCGVAILLQVCAEFEHCPPAGSFNINRYPFGLDTPSAQRAGLARLHKLGFEIANHTFDHDNLADLDSTGVQEDMVRLQRMVHAAVPGAQVATMALPFGVSPLRRVLARTGRWDGESYLNEGVLQVGANPSASPFSTSFDPGAVPRIRSMSADGGRLPLTANYWLDALQADPSRRYISAGNPGHVTVPAALRHRLSPKWAGKVITY